VRRRRNELEYPQAPGDEATVDEAGQAIDHAAAMITAADGLIGQLGLF
jgi:hypothetical protein